VSSCWRLLCSESGEIEDEITDLIQHIQRIHCLESKGCVCYAANENRVSTAVSYCDHNKLQRQFVAMFQTEYYVSILCQQVMSWKPCIIVIWGKLWHQWYGVSSRGWLDTVEIVMSTSVWTISSTACLYALSPLVNLCAKNGVEIVKVKSTRRTLLSSS